MVEIDCIRLQLEEAAVRLGIVYAQLGTIGTSEEIIITDHLSPFVAFSIIRTLPTDPHRCFRRIKSRLAGAPMVLEIPQQLWYTQRSAEQGKPYPFGGRISGQRRNSLERGASHTLQLFSTIITHAELELLRLSFRTKTLRDLCERSSVAVDVFGEKDAAFLQDALAELRAAPSIDDIPQWHQRLVPADSPHELKFDFAGAVTVYFEANHIRMPIDSRNEIAWEHVTSIKILKVERSNG